MKMTKNWKRFWTLDRHHAEGFTLVELIVVIAILAILAGVAVPAYSGYIAEANKAADRTLIRDIEQALMMGYYQGLLEKNGKVVLSTGALTYKDIDPVRATDGANIKGIHAALQATFGADFADKLVLKHDKWGFDGSLISAAQAKAVYDSSYYKSADKLMGQVEDITNAAWNLVTNNSGVANRDQMVSMFEGDLLNQVAGQYGYNSINDVPDDALPNLLVLAVATDVAQGTTINGYQTSEASNLIQNFALYNGYAAQNADFANDYDTFVNELNAASDVNSVAAAYRNLQAATNKYPGWTEYQNSTQSQTDSKAFAAMMSGMAGAAMTHGEGIKNGLTQSDFFTAGLGSELFAGYMDTVGAMAGMGETEAEVIFADAAQGNVVIFFAVDQGKISIGNTLPTE